MNADLPEDDYDEDLVEPARMVSAVPQCSAADNEYSPVQTQGELSWCISPEGTPLHDTLTRGKVQCEKNGTVLYRQSIGPICPDRSVKPMVCTDQCLHASCKLHPEAVCVMDVCGNCKPSFFRQSTGELVECEEKCSQPPADPGYCRAFMPRYTYNASAGRCEQFIFGGCHGNDNNFKTMEECQRECELPQPVCQLPMKTGPCRASKTRWFFNRDAQTCEQFWYSGCGGNANNFATKEQCENRCPDVVLCPYLNDGEMKSCSRTEACRNVSCINSMNPDEYICHVDPCTCEATLKDVAGKDIICPEEPIIVIEPKELNEVPTETLPSLVESSSDLPLEADENTQSLQVLMDISSLKSKCVEMAAASRVKCDPNGHFMPVQCPFTNAKCHCVDEAGNHLENSPIFALGTQSCEHVPVKQIDIILNFPTPFETEEPSSVKIGVEAQDLLRKMEAHLMEDKVEVEILPESTNLRFTLIGNNKVDISHNLEEMVRTNMIGLREHGQFIPADLSLSRFSHMVDISPDAGPKPVGEEEVPTTTTTEAPRQVHKSNPFEEEVDSSENEIDDASVSAESLAVDAEYNIVAVLLTVVVAISVLLAGFGMFLALQKKKHTGSYPKKPFDSLAFTSQIYDFESTTKKVPLDLPTFKATPPSNMHYDKSSSYDNSSNSATNNDN